MIDLFDGIVERMEQIPEEIRPFSEWLHSRAPRNAVEIGVRYGGTVALWHRIVTGRVIGIDWGKFDSLGMSETVALSQAMEARYSRYTFILGDSHEEVTKHQLRVLLHGQPIDFLFLDGDHSEVGVRRDFEMYSPLVREGGVIAFHDIVDSPLIRSAGQGVCDFWRTLEGEKVEFCVGGVWGGIGAVIK